MKDVELSADGKLLATVGEDGSIKLWELGGLDELIEKGCDWVKDYFENPNNDLTDDERKICD